LAANVLSSVKGRLSAKRVTKRLSSLALRPIRNLPESMVGRYPNGICGPTCDPTCDPTLCTVYSSISRSISKVNRFGRKMDRRAPDATGQWASARTTCTGRSIRAAAPGMSGRQNNSPLLVR